MTLHRRVLLALLLAITLVSCTREGPDRTPFIQGPLILFVLAAPVLSHSFRRRSRGSRAAILGLQVLAYAVYETGVSIETNIRIDIPLLLAAMVVSAGMALRLPVPLEQAPSRRPASVTLVGVFGILLGVLGVFRGGFMISYPSIIRNASQWSQLSDLPAEMQQAAKDRLSVPSWFSPYCIAIGLAGLCAASACLWGAVQTLRLRRNGPTLLIGGALGDILVSACTVVVGLLSSVTALREGRFLSIGALVVSGVLVQAARTRDPALFSGEQAPPRARPGVGSAEGDSERP